jgi:hypothetical protein
MRFSLFKQYGAKNSEPVFDAFEHSLRQAGHTIEHDSMHSDVAVIWSVLFNGRMSSNRPIYEYYTRTGKKVIVLEVGGIKRGTTWKVGLNGINRDAFWGDTGNDDSRARSLGLGLKPWRKDGEYILICGQHDKSLQWRNMPSMSQWIIDTIETIQKHSKRPIIFRPHPRCPLPHIEHEFKNVKRQEPKHIAGTYDDFDMAFDDIYCTVSWSSNPGIHSVINGVPAFVGPSSLAYDVAGHDLNLINYPQTPDRTQWLNDYAWTEYTVEEIAAGLPLKRLTPKL